MKFSPEIVEDVHNVLTKFQIDARSRRVKNKCFEFENVKQITQLVDFEIRYKINETSDLNEICTKNWWRCVKFTD